MQVVILLLATKIIKGQRVTALVGQRLGGEGIWTGVNNQLQGAKGVQVHVISGPTLINRNTQ